jgi:hypothetical protein
MKNIHYIFIYTLLVMSAFTNCVFANEMSENSSDNKKNTLTMCKEPRPQICTQDYRPVCGQLMDGGVKTYSNGCSACSDKKVKGYREGACEGDK